MGSLEIFKDVVGYEGKYQVTSWGRVYNVDSEKFMRMEETEKGYFRVDLHDGCGKRKHCKVHRLVAQAFIENPKGLPQVNHIDGNKSNNVVSNLEWCTNGENQIHAYSLGLNKVTGRAGRKKIRVRQIDPITGIAIAEYDSLADAGRKTDAHWINIRNAALGKRKTAGGYQWAFA